MTAWADRFNVRLDGFMDRWTGVILVGMIGVLVVWVMIAGFAYGRHATATCRVSLASGGTVEARGCEVDVYYPGGWVQAGKTGYYRAARDGSGALVCRGVAYAPGEWGQVTCE